MLKIKIKNSKKADISVTIFVIGVLAVCTLTILSFSYVKSKSNAFFSDSFNILEGVNSDVDKIHFYENIGVNPENFLDVKKEGNNYLIQRSSTRSVVGLFGSSPPIVLFSVEYRIPAKP